MTNSDTSNDTTSDAPAEGDVKRKARVIDGTAEDVTDGPAVSATGQRAALTIAAPVAAFFGGAAILAAVLWQAGLLNQETGQAVLGGGSVPSDVSAQLESADTRISALLRDVERLGGELQDAQEARGALESKLTEMEAELAVATGTAVEELARADDLNAALRLITEIDGRLADAETGVGVAATAVQPDQIAALQAVIDGLEERVTAVQSATQGAAAAERRVAAMEAGVAAIGSQQTTQATELGTVRTEIGALSARADAAQETLAAQGERLSSLAAEDESLQGRLTAVESRVDRPEAARRAARGIALASLAGVANEGKPFQSELAAVGQLAPDAEQVTALEAASATGVANAPTLLRRFQPVARDALRADAAGNADSVWQRFTGNALSLITVRQTGAVEGDGLEAQLARMEVALGDGDVAAAVAEAGAIEGPAAEAIGPWLADARARADVNSLVADLRTSLLSDLATAHQPDAADESVAPSDEAGSAAQ
ncbi:MAG: mitofilin family membrane protein [Candidatus Phaeomarinobacter sp.]